MLIIASISNYTDILNQTTFLSITVISSGHVISILDKFSSRSVLNMMALALLLVTNIQGKFADSLRYQKCYGNQFVCLSFLWGEISTFFHVKKWEGNYLYWNEIILFIRVYLFISIVPFYDCKERYKMQLNASTFKENTGLTFSR